MIILIIIITTIITERIMMPVALPLKSIFATPLQIRALDTRLGGWLKPVVGTRWRDGWIDI
jgi:hypothetical protein